MTATAARPYPGSPFKAIRSWGCLLLCALALHARAEEGAALGIIFDTSGSMADAVRDGNGGNSPKELRGQLEFILEEKIRLEEEDSKKL